ncbi:MAG: hypothetical protein Sylvanvirus2_4 [Sylvanvirus sp.]|uniref:RING-type domain-containing protein n=1 Tax=Sylvanvirus sp. TaxID=2487774 RepID=A0A3G5AH96_9VIRU|nr:MAG: hypothetical protein Sylvanvirus2_4 [Sylvanvirus sp.]
MGTLWSKNVTSRSSLLPRDEIWNPQFVRRQFERDIQASYEVFEHNKDFTCSICKSRFPGHQSQLMYMNHVDICYQFYRSLLETNQEIRCRKCNHIFTSSNARQDLINHSFQCQFICTFHRLDYGRLARVFNRCHSDGTIQSFTVEEQHKIELLGRIYLNEDPIKGIYAAVMKACQSLSDNPDFQLHWMAQRLHHSPVIRDWTHLMRTCSESIKPVNPLDLIEENEFQRIFVHDHEIEYKDVVEQVGNSEYSERSEGTENLNDLKDTEGITRLVPEKMILPSISHSVISSDRINEIDALSIPPLSPLCLMCQNAPYNVLFLPCRHVCACTLCATKIKKCPICRLIINRSEKIYLA